MFPNVLRQDDIQADVPGVFYILFLNYFFYRIDFCIVQCIGLYLGRKRIFIPPPLKIYIFSQKKQRDFRATLPTTK